jgi:hypothetical protein
MRKAEEKQKTDDGMGNAEFGRWGGTETKVERFRPALVSSS